MGAKTYCTSGLILVETELPDKAANYDVALGAVRPFFEQLLDRERGSDAER